MTYEREGRDVLVFIVNLVGFDEGFVLRTFNVTTDRKVGR